MTSDTAELAIADSARGLGGVARLAATLRSLDPAQVQAVRDSWRACSFGAQAC
jgi:hypothetical protein